MDFSLYGAKDGALKAVKVIGYVGLSAAVAAVGTYVGGLHPSTPEYVILLAVVNALISGLEKWLSTKKPDGLD